MNFSDDREPRTAQLNRAVREKCVVWGDPIGEQCLCKIHYKKGGPIMLCCPSCAVQYLDSERSPADDREQELRGFEKNTHFFIGEHKPSS